MQRYSISDSTQYYIPEDRDLRQRGLDRSPGMLFRPNLLEIRGSASLPFSRSMDDCSPPLRPRVALVRVRNYTIAMLRDAKAIQAQGLEPYRQIQFNVKHAAIRIAESTQSNRVEPFWLPARHSKTRLPVEVWGELARSNRLTSHPTVIAVQNA
jgi:hypothetical protein